MQTKNGDVQSLGSGIRLASLLEPIRAEKKVGRR
jgi:hypothetical protein